MWQRVLYVAEFGNRADNLFVYYLNGTCSHLAIGMVGSEILFERSDHHRVFLLKKAMGFEQRRLIYDCLDDLKLVVNVWIR